MSIEQSPPPKLSLHWHTPRKRNEKAWNDVGKLLNKYYHVIWPSIGHQTQQFNLACIWLYYISPILELTLKNEITCQFVLF